MIEDRAKVVEAWVKAIEDWVVQVVKYKDFDTFKADSAIAVTGAYNLRFDDYKKKVADAFLSLNLC